MILLVLNILHIYILHVVMLVNVSMKYADNETD